ncbi:MAG: hypothetical protein BWX53_00049 [Parcubacteria group bacterium ADurb.Bin016]|nr:MAG: hypothetical protein BWX53_00049 [Parcubacteria group bacterium ADurb.Bin016]
MFLNLHSTMIQLDLKFFEHIIDTIVLLYNSCDKLSVKDAEYIDVLLIQCQHIILSEKENAKEKAVIERFPIQNFILGLNDNKNSVEEILNILDDVEHTEP